MPSLNFQQRPNSYFMYHHTPNDTFDKIIPEDMRYLTAAYATIFYLAAEMDVDFRQYISRAHATILCATGMKLCGKRQLAESWHWV